MFKYIVAVLLFLAQLTVYLLIGLAVIWILPIENDFLKLVVVLILILMSIFSAIFFYSKFMPFIIKKAEETENFIDNSNK